MSDIKNKSIETIREMLFELSCSEDIDSNKFDIQFDNEQEFTQGFSVNINELSGVACSSIDKLTQQVAELRGVLAKALEYVEADIENKIKPYNPAHLGCVISEALKESE